MTLYDTKIPFRMILAPETELSHNIHSKGVLMINPFFVYIIKISINAIYFINVIKNQT